MASYMGIVYNPSTDDYGVDMFKKATEPGEYYGPEYYLKTDGINLDMNEQDLNQEEVRNGLDEDRNGYYEPEGDVKLTAHTKTISEIFYGVLGRYIFTGNGEDAQSDPNKKMNVHEFWAGENLDRPQFNADIASADFLLARIFGAMWNEMEWNAGMDKTTIDLDFIYKTEATKDIYLDSYRSNWNVFQGLPLVGYDYTMYIGKDSNQDGIDDDDTDMIVSQCFKEFTLKIENNLTTGDDNRCLGKSRTYTIKPTSENMDIEVEAKTRFDRRNYSFIVGARHGGYAPVNKWDSPKTCTTFTKKLYIEARSCIDPDEYVVFIFPKCKVKVDGIDGGSNNIESTVTLTPINTENVTLSATSNGQPITRRTAMYVKVVTEAGRVAEDLKN